MRQRSPSWITLRDVKLPPSRSIESVSRGIATVSMSCRNVATDPSVRFARVGGPSGGPPGSAAGKKGVGTEPGRISGGGGGFDELRIGGSGGCDRGSSGGRALDGGVPPDGGDGSRGRIGF